MTTLKVIQLSLFVFLIAAIAPLRAQNWIRFFNSEQREYPTLSPTSHYFVTNAAVPTIYATDSGDSVGVLPEGQSVQFSADERKLYMFRYVDTCFVTYSFPGLAELAKIRVKPGSLLYMYSNVSRDGTHLLISRSIPDSPMRVYIPPHALDVYDLQTGLCVDSISLADFPPRKSFQPMRAFFTSSSKDMVIAYGGYNENYELEAGTVWFSLEEHKVRKKYDGDVARLTKSYRNDYYIIVDTASHVTIYNTQTDSLIKRIYSHDEKLNNISLDSSHTVCLVTTTDFNHRYHIQPYSMLSESYLSSRIAIVPSYPVELLADGSVLGIADGYAYSMSPVASVRDTVVSDTPIASLVTNHVAVHLPVPCDLMTRATIISVASAIDKTLPIDDLSDDRRTLDFDISSYTSGVYLLVIRTNKRVYTSKFVIVRS